MAETNVITSLARPASESAKLLGAAAEDIDQLMKLATEFDSIASGSPGPQRSKALVVKTREIHTLCQKIKVTTVARIGGAGELSRRQDVGALIDLLQKVRDVAAVEATRRQQ